MWVRMQMQMQMLTMMLILTVARQVILAATKAVVKR
jgi:hypothetical protein